MKKLNKIFIAALIVLLIIIRANSIITVAENGDYCYYCGSTDLTSTGYIFYISMGAYHDLYEECECLDCEASVLQYRGLEPCELSSTGLRDYRDGDGEIHIAYELYECSYCGYTEWVYIGGESCDMIATDADKQYIDTGMGYHIIEEEYECSDCGYTECRTTEENCTIGNEIVDYWPWDDIEHAVFWEWTCPFCGFMDSFYMGDEPHNWQLLESRNYHEGDGTTHLVEELCECTLCGYTDWILREEPCDMVHHDEWYIYAYDGYHSIEIEYICLLCWYSEVREEGLVPCFFEATRKEVVAFDYINHEIYWEFTCSFCEHVENYLVEGLHSWESF